MRWVQMKMNMFDFVLNGVPNPVCDINIYIYSSVSIQIERRMGRTTLKAYSQSCNHFVTYYFNGLLRIKYTVFAFADWLNRNHLFYTIIYEMQTTEFEMR